MFRPSLLLLAAAGSLFSQTETALINGIVTDEAGHGVAGVSVSVTSAATGQVRSAVTSRQGEYHISGLLPGNYTVGTTAPGSRSEEIAVFEGGRLRVDLTPLSVTSDSSATYSIGGERVRSLPLLTRDEFQVSELAGNASDAGVGTRGVGLAINGQRESSTNVLLDGADARNEFTGAVGQRIPLDAVQDLVVFPTSFTAEYGRASGGVVSVAGRSGTNSFYGSAYEFNRVSNLASNSFLNNASGITPSGFNRNQFGYALGGPALKRKLFFFSSTEAALVRGDATVGAWVPTSQLLAESATGTQNFFQTLGQLRSDARSTGTVNLNDLTAIYGRNPCVGLACATLPAGLPLFNHLVYSAPVDGGAGLPQNTWNSYNRLDYNLSDRTWIYGRYALTHENDFNGGLSSSPYSNYDLAQRQFDNSFLVSLTRGWNPRWLSQTKVAFTRFTIEQQGLTSRGVVPTMYANPLAPVPIGTDPTVFPGYNPLSPGSGGAFGGPQNVLEVHHDTSWTKGRHLLRFGGEYVYIRDNRTDAAFQTAVDSLSNGGGIGPALNGLLSGQFASIEVAVDPQGKLPCAPGASATSCSLTLPVHSPSFSRSNRFNEGALYAQDYWRLGRKISINLGVRWEHYGVQHNGDANLDSNWYAPGIGFADNSLGHYLRTGELQPVPKSPIGSLWKPDWKDFAPRIGFAWDLSASGKTVIRAGYGMAYERNFGNVTFNVIQNLPGYAVLDVPGPITTNNFGPLSAASGSITLPPVGARIIDPGLKTASARFWNASAQRQITSRLIYTFEYNGSKGVNLYSISYPNQAGFGNFVLGDPCTGNADCVSQPNQTYAEDVGYRGNQGFSNYYGLNNRLTVRDIWKLGIQLSVNYTWSHATDNLSSTFFETGAGGVTGQYGNRNITTNNGDFDTGLLDPYQPALDKGAAEFDVRHRVALSGDWTIPFKGSSGWMSKAFAGWHVTSIFIARSGQPFSIFDTSTQTLDLSAPRASFTNSAPTKRNTFVPTTAPDVFHVITFLPSQILRQPNPLTPGAQWPANMSHRDAFRAPGFWNLDAAVFKDTKVTERFTLQIRGEAFNVFNHANLYVIGTSADIGSSNTVDACFGCTGSSYDRRQFQLGARFLF